MQLYFALLFNANLKGFVSGSIYKGSTKKMGVPGINCYSCPGALGSCPIGSMQAVASGNRHNFSFYVFGMIALFGVLLGRLRQLQERGGALSVKNMQPPVEKLFRLSGLHRVIGVESRKGGRL